MSSIPSLTMTNTATRSPFGSENNCCQGIICCVKDTTIHQNIDNKRVIFKSEKMIPTDSAPTVQVSCFEKVLCCFTKHRLRDDELSTKQNIEARQKLYTKLKKEYGEKAAKVAEYYLDPNWKEDEQNDKPLLVSDVKEAYKIAAESKEKTTHEEIKSALDEIKKYMKTLEEEHGTILSNIEKEESSSSSSSRGKKKHAQIYVKTKEGEEEVFSRRVIKKDLKKSRIFKFEDEEEIQEIANQVKKQLEKDRVEKIQTPQLRRLVSNVMKQKKCKINSNFENMRHRQSVMENFEKAEQPEDLDPKAVASLLKLRSNKKT